MSTNTDTNTESDSDAHQPRNSDGTSADTGPATCGDGDPDTASDGEGGVERDDHHLTVTHALDNPATADVAFLRERNIPIEAILQNRLGERVEDLLHEMKQSAKYQQQQQAGQQSPHSQNGGQPPRRS